MSDHQYTEKSPSRPPRHSHVNVTRELVVINCAIHKPTPHSAAASAACSSFIFSLSRCMTRRLICFFKSAASRFTSFLSVYTAYRLICYTLGGVCWPLPAPMCMFFYTIIIAHNIRSRHKSSNYCSFTAPPQRHCHPMDLSLRHVSTFKICESNHYGCLKNVLHATQLHETFAALRLLLSSLYLRALCCCFFSIDHTLVIQAPRIIQKIISINTHRLQSSQRFGSGSRYATLRHPYRYAHQAPLPDCSSGKCAQNHEYTLHRNTHQSRYSNPPRKFLPTILTFTSALRVFPVPWRHPRYTTCTTVIGI